MGREMLGIPHRILAPTMNLVTGDSTFYGEQLTNGPFVGGDPTGVVQTANVNITIPIFGQRSIFHQLERRISVHLESDIPVNKTVAIQNQNESSNYDLGSFILPRDLSASIDIDGTTVQDTAVIECNTYSSQTVLQNRSDKTTMWSPMLRLGDDFRYCTLRLYLTVRDYDPINDRYNIKREVFPFETANDYWSCDLKFVSNV